MWFGGCFQRHKRPKLSRAERCLTALTCYATVAQISRNIRVCGHALKLCLGKMSDGKLPVLDQRHRSVYHSRQLGRACVTPARLLRKENSVRHQIRFHSVVGASLYQRNLAAFSLAAIAARHRFFPSCRVHRQRQCKDSSINNIYNASVPRYFWMRGTSSGHTAEIATSLAASQ